MKKTLIMLFFIITSLLMYGQNQTIDGDLTTYGNISLRSTDNLTPYNLWGKRLFLGRPYENTDSIYFSRVNIRGDHSELRLVLGDDGSEKFAIGYNLHSNKQWQEGIIFTAKGYIGIGVSQPTCALDVAGTIRSKEVKIEATNWADYVFREDYKLPSLKEVEEHIKTNNTLPDIPSEQEVKENGISLGDMQVKLLQKIEELTLYMIKQEKEIEALKEENRIIKEELKNK